LPSSINDRRLLIFPAIFLLLILFISCKNWPAIRDYQQSLLYTYACSFLEGKIGSGFAESDPQYVPFEQLEPGDIILGGWPNCAYGDYSHAGLYLGDYQVLESYVDYGVCIQPIDHYRQYTKVCLLKVNASHIVKEQVVAKARSYEGQLFFPLAFKNNDNYWNCSKIIWKAYADYGIDLDIYQDMWIAPESFRDASQVSRIYEKEI